MSNSNIRLNSHFWALYKGAMAVFYKDKSNSIYIAGCTESEFTESEITFVEYVYNPRPQVLLYFETFCS